MAKIDFDCPINFILSYRDDWVKLDPEREVSSVDTLVFKYSNIIVCLGHIWFLENFKKICKGKKI